MALGQVTAGDAGVGQGLRLKLQTWMNSETLGVRKH